MRYFIAVPITKVNQKKLVKYQENLIDCGAKIKFAEEKNLHVTMVFLGEVSKKVVLCAFDEVKNFKFNGFEAEVKGVYAFPSDFNPRVLFAGFGKGREKLIDLIESIENLPKVKQILNLQKQKAIKKEIIPHITIGRVKPYLNKRLTETILNAVDLYFFDINVNEVQLWGSNLTSKGPVYCLVERVVF